MLIRVGNGRAAHGAAAATNSTADERYYYENHQRSVVEGLVAVATRIHCKCGSSESSPNYVDRKEGNPDVCDAYKTHHHPFNST